MLRKKPSEQEALQIWQTEYCRDHVVRGHANHCYAWLDNGVCPQMMVSGSCCFPHCYPATWKDDVKEKHRLLVQYMENLYQGCDVLDLVGKGKKNSGTAPISPLLNSRCMADKLAEAIDRKVDRIEKEMVRAHSIADFRFIHVVQPQNQVEEEDCRISPTLEF